MHGALGNVTVWLTKVPLVAVACGLLLVVGIFTDAQRQGGFLSRVGEQLGDASYAIYLSHEAFLSAALGGLSKFKEYIPIEASFFISISFVLVMGLLVHRWIEKPLVEIFNPRRNA